MQLSGLSTQLSMAQALMQPDMLQHLQSLGSDARLSIFDDTITKPDVSPVAVVAKLASAAKTWQRFKSPESQGQINSPEAASVDADEEASTVETLPGFLNAIASAESANISNNVAGSSHSEASSIPGRSAAAARAESDEKGNLLPSSSANRGSSSVAGHKVGFVEPGSREAEDASAAGEIVGAQQEPNAAEQQAPNADMRAQLAAGIHR